ncbi:unnamed protein product [Brugia timori]|uniref:Uncharacterized protein n=1 Tax=Brugia timori TaxID=42155 RepID=A0A0R3Q378_9BILA|nr:unnamed protein product [Brugia timori]
MGECLFLPALIDRGRGFHRLCSLSFLTDSCAVTIINHNFGKVLFFGKVFSNFYYRHFCSLYDL